jgi:16S rRNA C1402 (ribose-2'-O) methylase RsmI
LVNQFLLRKKDCKMTVGTQVKQAIAGLKSAQASFEGFALATENQNAKQIYQQAAQQTQSVLDSVEPRLQEILGEEPQYNQ